jgi:hypothetical protein
VRVLSNRRRPVRSARVVALRPPSAPFLFRLDCATVRDPLPQPPYARRMTNTVVETTVSWTSTGSSGAKVALRTGCAPTEAFDDTAPGSSGGCLQNLRRCRRGRSFIRPEPRERHPQGEQVDSSGSAVHDRGEGTPRSPEHTRTQQAVPHRSIDFFLEALAADQRGLA